MPAHAEQRHQALKCQGDIEVITAYPAAAVPQQAVFTIATVMPLGAHQQQRAVRRAPADVHDQYALLFRQRGFKIQPRRNRLVLEYHVAEACPVRRAFQDPLRLLVGLVAAQPLEVNWSANHRLGNRLWDLRLRLVADVQHHRTHQVFEQRDLLRLQAAGAEEGFWRLNEVDLFGVFNVVSERGEAELHAGRRNVDIFLAVEADGTA